MSRQGAALGVQTLIDLCQNSRSEQVHLSAARELVDRGYGPIVSRNATIRAETSVEDLLEILGAKEAATRQEPAIGAQATSDGRWEVNGESVD